MNKLHLLSLWGLLLLTIGCTNQKSEHSGRIEFVEELLEKMTIEEKVGQLAQYTGLFEMTGPVPEESSKKALYDRIKSGQVGSMLNVNGADATRKAQDLALQSRLSIPLIIGYDVIHGYVTMFPIPLAEAASFNPESAYKSSRVAAIEASASGVHWTFAPMVDIGRDARWGRVMEGAGEDTYLGVEFAKARVKGFQGDDLSDNNTVAACAKHFAGYGFVEAGREYNTTTISEATLHNVVLPPFKACVEAGAATFMTGFNELNGMPVTASNYLVRDLLKTQWGFDGIVVSDYASINELIAHGVAQDKKEAAILAINAGMDMDMEGQCYSRALAELVKEGTVDIALLDDACRRILNLKHELGLFEDPYRYCDTQRESELVYSNEHQSLALESAREAIVLMKNEGEILPLNPTKKQRIAVIGELAADKNSPLGSWRAKSIPNSAVSLLEGLENYEHNSKISYARGPKYVISEHSFLQELEINTTDNSGIKEAVALAKNSDKVVLCIGENCFQSGEGRAQTEIKMSGFQEELLDAVAAVNKNIIVILMNGRPLDLSNVVDKAKAVVECWHLGSQSGNAIAEVLWGKYNPSGRLPMSFPRNVGQCPIYYNQKHTGRSINKDGNVFWSHYTDSENSPLFPFGYGLSYTSFSYDEIRLNTTQLTPDNNIELSVKITNTGKYDGAEVVQLYIRDHVASLAPMKMQLKGVDKVFLKVGESTQINFTLSPENLAIYTANKEWKAESGDFSIWLGLNPTEKDILHFSYEE